MYDSDRGIEELDRRRGEEEVTLAWVADRLEQWFVERACDGYVVGGTHTPGTFEDFVKFAIPELQKRGLYWKDYKGATLRENLGLPMPARGHMTVRA